MFCCCPSERLQRLLSLHKQNHHRVRIILFSFSAASAPGARRFVPLFSTTMMLPSLLALFALFGASFSNAQANSSVVCVAGQCIQGFTNTSSEFRGICSENGTLTITQSARHCLHQASRLTSSYCPANIHPQRTLSSYISCSRALPRKPSHPLASMPPPYRRLSMSHSNQDLHSTLSLSIPALLNLSPSLQLLCPTPPLLSRQAPSHFPRTSGLQ